MNDKLTTSVCNFMRKTAVNSFGEKKSPELLQHVLKIGLTKTSPESQLSALQLIISVFLVIDGI